jgi:hypothetical protein
MIMEKQAAEWSREALALLGARLADMRGESTKLTRDIFVTDLTDAATAAEVFEKTAGRLVGMLNLAFKLLVELEEATDRPAEDWLGGLASWLTMIEGELGGEAGA